MNMFGDLELGQLVAHKRMSTFGKVIGGGFTSKGVLVYMCEVPDTYPLHIWCGTMHDIVVLQKKDLLEVPNR